MNKLKCGSGDILIATMTLVDPVFINSVVLVCEHELEKAAYGLVLNKPVDLHKDFLAEIPFVEGRIFEGGPVQRDVLQIVHRCEKYSEGAMQVMPNLWVGGDMDRMEVDLRCGVLDPSECIFFLGYSGWSEGQLEQELEDEAWLCTSGLTAEKIFEMNSEQLWSEAVRLYGKKDPLYRYFPDDVSCN